MSRARWRIAAAVLVIAATFAACSSGTHLKGTLTPVTVPSSIPCASGDQSSALSAYLNGLPANSVVNFPAGGTCVYHVSTSLVIHGTSNLAINGNGDTIDQTVAGPSSSPVDPIMELYENHDLAITDLNVEGQGSDGGGTSGVNYEGDLGWLLEANHGVLLTDINTDDTQGDCIELNAPDDSFITSGDVSLNTNVTFTGSTFSECGYHGLTIEAANDVLFRGDTFTDMGTDAMDFEYDSFSTDDVDGTAQYAAEDNINITDDSWTTFGGDWFASLQGETDSGCSCTTPGVAEHNVVLADNTINSPTKAIEVTGTATGIVTSRLFEFTNLTITHNTWNGSNPIDSSPSGMDITYVEGLTFSGNNFAYDSGLYVMQLNAVTNPTVVNNTWTAATGIFYTGSTYTGLTECGNHWGTGGASTDSSC